MGAGPTVRRRDWRTQGAWQALMGGVGGRKDRKAGCGWWVEPLTAALSGSENPESQREKPQPAVPPRPSADLILHRCSESTKRKLASTVSV